MIGAKKLENSAPTAHLKVTGLVVVVVLGVMVGPSLTAVVAGGRSWCGRSLMLARIVSASEGGWDPNTARIGIILCDVGVFFANISKRGDVQ